jgi:adenylate cyclase
MSKSVIRNKATILKYVGDEVILTWPKKRGVKHNRCINFYFDFFDELEKHKFEFVEKYGVFPKFKAGLHVGIVTAAYIGTIKKQMDYSGDVMNTAARIQSVCNDFEANFLISTSLADMLSSDDKIVFSNLGCVELKGKIEKVSIKRVQRL